MYGADSSTNGPHIAVYTSADTTYPIFQQLNWAHNNIGQLYDAYYNGTAYYSSSTTSNYLIYKYNDIFQINYNNGATKGSAIPNLLTNQAIAINNVGQSCFGSAPTSTGAYRAMIYGTANSSSASAGAHFQIVTSTDNYPIYHIAGIDHNNINLTFDGYFDGTTYRSSSTNGVFQLTKASNQLQFITSPGGTQGSVPTLSVAGYFDTSGNLNLNNNIAVGGNLSSNGQPCLIMSSSSYISVTNATNTLFNGFDTTIFSQGSITFASNSTATVPSTGTYMIVTTGTSI
jgi:hypothetical protein